MPLVMVVGSFVETKLPRAMTLLGLISYRIYAIHEPHFTLADQIGNMLGFAAGAAAPYSRLVFLAALIFVAISSIGLYDIPVRRRLSQR
jgi:peptidoglycan/LPS O-acetylase OafA/YrhL